MYHFVYRQTYIQYFYCLQLEKLLCSDSAEKVFSCNLILIYFCFISFGNTEIPNSVHSFPFHFFLKEGRLISIFWFTLL